MGETESVNLFLFYLFKILVWNLDYLLFQENNIFIFDMLRVVGEGR